jgi:hypothetical protein
MSEIIDFKGAAERLVDARIRQGEFVTVGVNERGHLEISRKRGAIVLESYEADDRQTERILLSIGTAYRIFIRKKQALLYPVARPMPKVPKWRRCRIWPGQGNYRLSCVRRGGHVGLHRDKTGQEFIHACSQETRIVSDASGTRIVCHCGKDMG